MKRKGKSAKGKKPSPRKRPSRKAPRRKRAARRPIVVRAGKPSGEAATALLTDSMAPLKRPRGRPTAYDPAYCEQLLDHMAAGLSFQSFAGVIGVCKKTLHNWADANADFLLAKDEGTELCRLWWERLGIQGVQGLGQRMLQEETEEAVTYMGRPVVDKQGNPVLKVKRKFGAAQFVPGTWFRNMTNRFPEEWRDRHELTGRGGESLFPPMVTLESFLALLNEAGGNA